MATNKSRANELIRESFESEADAKLFKEFYHNRVICEVISDEFLIEIKQRLSTYPERFEFLYNNFKSQKVSDCGKYKGHFVRGEIVLLMYVINIIADAEHLKNVFNLSNNKR